MPELIAYIKAIVTAMTGNAYFPDPFIELNKVTQAVNQLSNAYEDSQLPNSGPDATALVQTRKFELFTRVEALASYVQYVANTDHAEGDSIIFSANMSVKTLPTNTGRFFQVFNDKVSGNVSMRTRSEGDASYEWQYTTTPADDSSWVALPSTSVANTTAKGYKAGTRVYFRVRANKGNTTGAWQGPVNLIIT